ncbi:MAG: hypothetical protein ACLFP2_04710 [Candidatus Woesearchaeota archaeon]
MNYVRIRDVIPRLDMDELVKIKRDLDSGSIHLKKLINDEIAKKKNEHSGVCAVCMKPIDPGDHDTFTLIFGPDDFKKKASFCAHDCMMYFISSLKKEV